MKLKVLLVLLLLLAACTPSVSGELHPASPTTDTPASVSEVGFVRTCRSSVYGTLGAGWRRESVIIGPIAFVGLAGVADAAANNSDQPLKVLAVVSAGSPVTVQVTAREPQEAALLYDLSKFNAADRVEEGDPAVTFVPCEPGESPFAGFGASGRSTQFNGGFIVSAPACVALDVSLRGDAPVRRWVSFGAGAHCGL